MLLGRHPQFFKIASVTVVTIVFITLATRQIVSPTLDSDVQRAEFVRQVEEKLAKLPKSKEHVNINSNNNNEEPDEDDTPIQVDERMPGAYLRFNDPVELNKSYCKYNYKFPYDILYFDVIKTSSPEQGPASPYRILYNVVEAHHTEKAAQVTYTTHMTANFANYIPEILRIGSGYSLGLPLLQRVHFSLVVTSGVPIIGCGSNRMWFTTSSLKGFTFKKTVDGIWKSWDGLVIIAAFVPDLDVALFLEQIHQYCLCEPEMYRVSIHIVTHKTVPFSKKDIYFEKPESCLPQDSSKIEIYKNYEDTMVYPVNVLRNVARTSALTKYVLSSDIELIPSKGLASEFLGMIEKYKSQNPKEVFVLPIFEVEDTESIPENKKTLLNLIKEKKAVYFHQAVCKHCQKFPGIEEWMSDKSGDKMKPLLTVKRHKPYHRWEPIFIGTNEEPLYAEKLSWEGLQDKMTQSIEMCLMDYSYTILNNAFLCHWPGMKKQKVTTEEWRVNYILENKVAYKEIIERFHEKYVDIPGCMTNDTSAVLTAQKEEKSMF